jgi:hypothetical protein
VKVELTIRVTSFMAKRGSKVKKNWLNAAHFHCCLSKATFADKDELKEGTAGDVAWGVVDDEVRVRVEVRRGMDSAAV